MKKIKNLDQYLTHNSGLDAVEREQWRNDISKLQKLGRKEDAWECLKSMSFWKNNIQNRLK